MTIFLDGMVTFFDKFGTYITSRFNNKPALYRLELLGQNISDVLRKIDPLKRINYNRQDNFIRNLENLLGEDLNTLRFF